MLGALNIFQPTHGTYCIPHVLHTIAYTTIHRVLIMEDQNYGIFEKIKQQSLSIYFLNPPQQYVNLLIAQGEFFPQNDCK